jgi:hypothetical protein
VFKHNRMSSTKFYHSQSSSLRQPIQRLKSKIVKCYANICFITYSCFIRSTYVGCSESKVRLRIQPAQKIDISELAKCTNNVRKCLIQLCTKLSPNICSTSTTKFVHVGYRVDLLNSQAAVWYEEGISKLVSRYEK